MALTLDRTDAQLRDRVLRQLESSRDVDAHDIGVRARDGEVTLVGSVRSFPEKVAAEDSVKRLFGVRAIRNDVIVRNAERLDDAELENRANAALEMRAGAPASITASVRDGVITLEGEVRWLYQRFAAEVAVAYLPGVCGINNRITLAAVEPPPALREEIEQALLRTAGLEWKRIHVSAAGGTVRLSGQVHSIREKEEAERAAWANPGVTKVESQLEVTARRWW